MTPSRSQVEALFEGALGRAPEERHVWLKNVCGGDDVLLSEVEALLAAHLRADGILSSIPEAESRPSPGSSDLDPHEALHRELGDRYSLEDILAEGGMGTVYRARDRKHDRLVAIKTIHPNLVDRMGLSRFRREIQVTATLRHPYILPLLDSGAAGRFLYYIMPCVEGESLRGRLAREGRLTTPEAVSIALDVAEGLEYAHRIGIIHRDIKPANILLEGGHGLICDFGVAKAVSEAAAGPNAAAITGTGRAIGTPAYMAPEQFTGEAGPESDVYALGAVLFECLTGDQWPIAGRSEPDWSGVDPGLRAVLRKALESKPEERWPDAGALRHELGEWRAGRAAQRAPSPASSGLVGRIRELLFGSSSGRPSKKSVAVLPIENLSRDEDTEVMADGITEDIITHLSRIRDLKVISRTSVMRYKNLDPTPRQIGRELGVANVLEGTIRRSGDRLRIVSQLVDTRTEECRWSETFDRDMTDIFGMQSEVARKIADSLQARISDTELSLIGRRPTENVEAHKLYLRGRFLWNRRTKDALLRAAASFERAIELDGEYAPAYAGLADTWLLLGAYGYRPEMMAVAEAKAAVEQALERDERLAEAHASLGQVWRTEMNWKAEETEYRRAIELNPNYATAHQWYATLLAALGRLDEALVEIRIAQDLDPLSNAIGVTAGSILCLRRDYGEAIAQLHRTLELDPNYFSPYAWLINACGGAGRREEAFRAFEKVAELRPDLPHPELFKALVHAFVGEPAPAREILRDVDVDETDPIWRAIIYACLGDADRAFDLLNGALDDDSWCMFRLTRNLLLYVKTGSWFDPVRSDPRFESLLRRMNLSA
ncbi:MAG: protein kinase [Candidatus Palauibacterales bacterium]|nr:protein kinase [Candidatus Palauibacterales bacterium]